VKSTFKASEHQCTIHDASYHGVIELVGTHSDVAGVISSMTPPDAPSVSNMMYEEKKTEKGREEREEKERKYYTM